jgi:oligopeptidase A
MMTFHFKAPDLEKIEVKLDRLLLKNRTELSHLLKGARFSSWRDLMLPLEVMENRLHRFWAPIAHIYTVDRSNKLKQIYWRCFSKIRQYQTAYLQNPKLYAAILSLYQSAHFSRLSSAKQKIVKDKLVAFKRGGAELNQAEQARFSILQAEIDELSTQFATNCLNARQDWFLHLVDDKRMKGVPIHALKTMRRLARKNHLKGYLVTLDAPIYRAIVTYAEDIKLRETVYVAYTTLASDQGGHNIKYDNSKLMAGIIEKRSALAALLKYKTYAHYALAIKMAKRPSKVFQFLNQLVDRAKPIAEQELKALQSFAKTSAGVKKLAIWDVAYYSEKLKKQTCQLTQEDLRPYFPENQVLKGLFECAERLYDLKIKPRPLIKAWHPTVRFFEVYRRRGGYRGAFYLDLYFRPNKRAGAWVAILQHRFRQKNGSVQPPIVCLNCDFSEPLHDEPACLTHREVITLFHEFGHCLHHVLTKSDYFNSSGLKSLEWDAIELPSLFMENFCWQPEVIQSISRHVKTGKSLSNDQLKSLIKMRQFQSGLILIKQLEYSLFDMHLYADFDAKKGAQVQRILAKVRKEVSVIQPPSYDRFPNTFDHIFSNLYPQYAAGYYSYRWAEVLSCDAFDRFETEGIFNKKTAKDFLKCILEMGALKPAAALFKSFRGRGPRLNSFLKHRGLFPPSLRRK